MLSTKTTLASVLIAAALVPAIASAAPPVQTAPAERAQAKDVTVDGWRYVGGETGWLLELPKFDIVDGRLVHADDCVLKPSLAKAPDVRRGGAVNEPLHIGA